MDAAATCSVCELHAEAVFRVEGMCCREEAVVIEGRLRPIKGIEALTTDLIGQRLLVKYDAALLNTATIVDAVSTTGMRLRLEHEEAVAQGSDAAWRARAMAACGASLAAGVALLAAGYTVPGRALCIAATVLGAIYPARRALAAIRSRALDINVLMVIAASGALLLGEWVEAASVVFLFSAAQWLEAQTMERARQAIRGLIDLAPREALVRRLNGEFVLPLDQVRIGDIVIVRPGDKVPLDGVVVRGQSDINEAPITGESLPVDKAAGDELFAGTLNGLGALEMKVRRLVRGTRLAHIIHLVEDAQASRAPVQTFVDRFARIYTPAIVLLAIAVAVVPWLSGSADPQTWAYRALVLLVIACPCALVISTPVSFVSALSVAARLGVLIKGGAHLERLAEATTVAFDKTGTLTSGDLQVVAVVPFGSWGETDLLRYASAVESRSSHPVARAVMQEAQRRGVLAPTVDNFKSLPGLGAEGTVEAQAVVVGSAALMRGRDVALEVDSRVANLELQGTSVVHIGINGQLAGAIGVADRPRPAAREAVELLRAQGIRHVVMLTGDDEATARTVAASLGVDDVRAGLMPEQKHQIVAGLRDRGERVLMVGDGVNDAPALAAADVGVAMGAAGSDVALETADVALMSDELLRLPYAVRLARATVRNVRTNVAISLALKLVFLAMTVGGIGTLWMAVLADTGATVIVVANALRLLRQT